RNCSSMSSASADAGEAAGTPQFLHWIGGAGGASTLSLRWQVSAVRALLQTFAVEDCDPATLVRDEPVLFECLQGNRDTGAVRAKHQAQELVGEGQRTTVDAVVRHQEP